MKEKAHFSPKSLRHISLVVIFGTNAIDSLASFEFAQQSEEL